MVTSALNISTLTRKIRASASIKVLRINIDFDIFNVLNKATVLGRQYNLKSTAGNNILEIQNPRIARIGVRFTF